MDGGTIMHHLKENPGADRQNMVSGIPIQGHSCRIVTYL